MGGVKTKINLGGFELPFCYTEGTRYDWRSQDPKEESRHGSEVEPASGVYEALGP
jgi:hypothetical protein